MSDTIENPREGFIPDSEQESPPVIAGDWGDDDPMAIDDIVQETPEPPAYADLPKGPDTLPETPAKKVSRSQGRRYYYADDRNVPGPIMLLPADPNRRSLMISTAGSGMPALLASDPNMLQGDGSLAWVQDTYYITKYDDWTGPVWCLPFDLTNNLPYNDPAASWGKFVIAALGTTV